MSRFLPYIACLTLWLLLLSNTSSAIETVTCADVANIADEVSIIRGLGFKESIPCREMDVENGDLLRYKEGQFTKLYPGDALKLEGILYKFLGLVPGNYDYEKCIVQGVATDVLSTYDSEAGIIILPKESAITPDGLAHELAHALQNQHFALNQLQDKANRATDSALAFAALAEGDAMLVQRKYRQRYMAMGNLKPNETSTTATTPCDLPPSLVRLFEFPYTYGLLFASRLNEHGGFDAINKVYSHPPISTSEIIHRDRYPRKVPESSIQSSRSMKAAGGNPGKLVHQDQVGQYTISLILENGVSKEEAILAAKGLVRDQVRIYEDTKRYSLEWVSTWESDTDAKQFQIALMASIEKRFNLKLEKSADSVVIAPNSLESIAITRDNTVVSLIMSNGLGQGSYLK